MLKFIRWSNWLKLFQEESECQRMAAQILSHVVLTNTYFTVCFVNLQLTFYDLFVIDLFVLCASNHDNTL